MLLAALLIGFQGTNSQDPVQNPPNKPPLNQTVPIGKVEEAKPVKRKTFSEKGIGVMFDYPETWTYKGADKKNPARFTIPIEGGGTGELKIIDLEFRGTPANFQETQATMIGRLGGNVVRQNQLEVLGVPLLLTKLRQNGANGDTTTLVGLLYAATPKKFNFRLTGPSDRFDALEYQWQSALETLRTDTGALPQTENGQKPKPAKTAGDVPLGPDGKPVPPPVKDVRTELAPRPMQKNYKGPVSAELAAGSQPAMLYLPAGWTSEPTGDGTVRLTNKGSGLVLNAQIFLAQADNPRAVLERAVLDHMASFDTIERRIDLQHDFTKGGGAAASVYRIGKGKDGGARMVFDGVYAQGEWFVALTGERAAEGEVGPPLGAKPDGKPVANSAVPKLKADAKAMDELLTALHVEAKPPAP